MILTIDFPQDLRTEAMLQHVRIPCLCKVAADFAIAFAVTVPPSEGLVSGWDRRELELRAVAGAGGEYTHYSQGLITLEMIGERTYRIVDLEMFYTRFGWCAVIRDGEYAEPGTFWDEDDSGL